MDEDIKKLQQEKDELNALIGKGVDFSVPDVEFEVEKRFFGLMKKRKRKNVTRSFKIVEPTLSTLDRLSAEWIEFALDEAAMKSTDALERSRRLVRDHSIRFARIVAIAALGEEREIPKPARGGGVKWVEDTERLDELTRLFARNIKPSKLYQMTILINAMCNLGDFTNSIRLMSSDRTAMPIRIEENKGV
mgnify:CR=1 FL=1